MVIKIKGGEFRTEDASVLFDFLGIRNGVAGAQRVKSDVELIASVPFIKEEGKKEESEEGFAWTLSTYDLDRYAERIDPAGWDIRGYLDNPVVEWAHNFLIPAIGKIERLTADNNGLHGRVFFNDKSYDPFGWSIGQRVKAGVIRAGSVGFRPIEVEIPSKADSKDGTTLIFRKQELLEFSICNVPANAFALTEKREQVTENREREESASPFWGSLIFGY